LDFTPLYRGIIENILLISNYLSKICIGFYELVLGQSLLDKMRIILGLKNIQVFVLLTDDMKAILSLGWLIKHPEIISSQ
jgi:hypothetical protein